MVQITKMLVFLCMLTGWSQAFPHRDVFTGNEAIKDADKIERERRDLTIKDSTPPECRVVNMTALCRSFDHHDELKVSYTMTDVGGSGVDHIHVFGKDPMCLINTKEYNGLDKDGNIATILYFSSNCCYDDVVILVVDKAGHTSTCPPALQRVTTTFKPTTVKPTSSSSITTISLWLSLILMTLKSMLL